MLLYIHRHVHVHTSCIYGSYILMGAVSITLPLQYLFLCIICICFICLSVVVQFAWLVFSLFLSSCQLFSVYVNTHFANKAESDSGLTSGLSGSLNAADSYWREYLVVSSHFLSVKQHARTAAALMFLSQHSSFQLSNIQTGKHPKDKYYIRICTTPEFC